MSSNPTLTLDELRLTPEYSVLTPKMKLFIDAYVESRGDILDAVHEAYVCKSGREEKIVSWQIMRHPKIIAVLEVWTNKDEKDIFLDNLKDLLRQKDVPVGKIRLMELHAELMGWIIPTAKIKAIAHEKSATVKQVRERNITRILSNQERRNNRAEQRRFKKESEPQRPPGRPKKEPDPVDYGLEIYESQADGDSGNENPA